MNVVHIPWSQKTSSCPTWNEITASIVEHFGLPGHRYNTSVTENYMDFYFKTEQDATMCKLLVSEYL